MATGTSCPNNMCAVNNNCKSNWDLSAIINLNARSLSIEKLDELKVTVAIVVHCSRGRALNTGPLRRDAQKCVKTSWHVTI